MKHDSNDQHVRVAIVPTGAANLASVRAAFSRLGAPTSPASTRDDVLNADALVLPGVGAFAAAMSRLRELDLVGPLRERITAGRPTLAICLGLQLLAAGSEESPDCDGLGVIASRCTRLQHARVPHLGWNRVVPDAPARVVAPGWACFANSFAIREPGALHEAGWSISTTIHGDPFAAAIERGAVVACQFHPELSGPWGAALLDRWLVRAREEVSLWSR